MAFKFWNKQIFCRLIMLHQRFTREWRYLKVLCKRSIRQRWSEILQFLKLSQVKWQKIEEIRLSQLTNRKWLKAGDNNQIFFHAEIAQHQKYRRLNHMILENGTHLSCPQQIRLKAVNYFECFLTEEHRCSAEFFWFD